MNKFKPGDRVAVYDNGMRMIGVFSGIQCQITGNYKIERAGYFGWYHPNQCRRLVKKKRRELDIYISPGGYLQISAIKYSDFPVDAGKTIRFIEAKK